MAYCKLVAIPGCGVALVRLAGKRPTCSCCGRDSSKLCDFPLTGVKAGKTCDKKLCGACAVPMGEGVDYCPVHARNRQREVEHGAETKA